MKIALVHYATPPVIGGVERIIGAHAQLFRAAGHEVVLVSQRGNADARLAQAHSASGYVDQLRRALAGCDVVIVHNVMTMPFDLELTEALTRLPGRMPEMHFVAWVHDIAAINPDLAPVHPLMREVAAGFSYVAVSDLRAHQFCDVTGITCPVIPNGIDPSEALGLSPELTRFAQEHHLFEGRIVLLHPTRLLKRKNVELGIETMAAWRDGGHSATLIITGAEDPHNPASHDYAVMLRALRHRLGLEEEVVFAGESLGVGDTELSGLFRLADALFLPSRQEGFGLPVLEAAVHRIPAFIADIPPMDALAGPSCRRFPLDTPPAQLATWIREEIEVEPGARARRHALRWRWTRIYEDFLAPLLRGEVLAALAFSAKDRALR